MTGITRYILAGVFLSGWLAGCQPSPSSTSHSHPPPGTEVTIWTDATELFFEYPAMIAGAEKKAWAVHVTRLSDFTPIPEGVLTLAFRSPDGTVFTTSTQAPAYPGIYAPAPQLPAPGEYDLIVDIDGPHLSDRIRAGSITVYASEDQAPGEDAALDETISFLKEQQWPIVFSVETAQQRDIAASIPLSAELVEAAGHVASVTSPVSGLVEARPNMKAPAQGDRVRQGNVLLSLSPTSEDNSFTRARADQERLSREVIRLQNLYDAGAIAEKRLIEAKHDLEISQATLTAMKAPEEGYAFPIKAPISGVILERHFTPGDLVTLGQPLYRVINPGYLWLKINVPARYATMTGSVTSAFFTVEGSERVYETQRVVSIGTVVDPTSRTIPIVMGVPNADESLKVGLIAQANVYVGDSQTGVSIPNSAILVEDGLSVAYVQVGGESFERRLLTLGPSDGTYTIVEDGISEGEHLVTKGAYQVYLASLNTNEISDHGHPH